MCSKRYFCLNSKYFIDNVFLLQLFGYIPFNAGMLKNAVHTSNGVQIGILNYWERREKKRKNIPTVKDKN